MSFTQEKKCFIKVVAIGDSGVGKTSLIQMFENSKFTENFKPTIGADFSNKEITINGRVVTLQIWDTAGQERYQSLGTAFYRGADCCLIVYDITNSLSFENVINWKNSFLNKSMVVNPEGFPFMIVGNKIDLENERQVSLNEGEKVCKQNGDLLFTEASARTNQNVEIAFQKLAANALKRQEEMQKSLDESMQNRRAQEREKNKRLGRPDKQAGQTQGSQCEQC
ncbi:cg5915-pa [Stylonychia lemnae]|uniref:Ras-related protein Rab-7b n=1 Tax=Stylonychia lemnae TaxID=5949 RepID=A0A078AN50_STYLE|nr:cg5915-pa [Stylonychia lemnae]|eukprot:CDW83790.1 cg5915-pa [Stylonychia lemnae]